MAAKNGSLPLAGRVALVTAAGRGLGRAVAERLVRDGAEVLDTDLSGALLAGLDAATTSAVDATDPVDIGEQPAGFNRVDAVVHAVGYVHYGTVEDCTPEAWRRSMPITHDSAYFVIRSVVPRWRSTAAE